MDCRTWLCGSLCLLCFASNKSSFLVLVPLASVMQCYWNRFKIKHPSTSATRWQKSVQGSLLSFLHFFFFLFHLLSDYRLSICYIGVLYRLFCNENERYITVDATNISRSARCFSYLEIHKFCCDFSETGPEMFLWNNERNNAQNCLIFHGKHFWPFHIILVASFFDFLPKAFWEE